MLSGQICRIALHFALTISPPLHPPGLQTIAKPTFVPMKVGSTDFLRPRLMHCLKTLYKLHQEQVCTISMTSGLQHHQQKAKLQSHSFAKPCWRWHTKVGHRLLVAASCILSRTKQSSSHAKLASATHPALATAGGIMVIVPPVSCRVMYFAWLGMPWYSTHR